MIVDLYIRSVKKIISIAFLLALFCGSTFEQKKSAKVIQFSGYTLTADSMMGVPFVHITIMHKGRVTMAGPDGYFSLAVMEGDTLYFTSIGYKPSVYIVPKGLEDEKFSVVQLMSKSELYIRETVIFPWRRENFHQVFMDTHPPEDDLDRAKKNLDRERLAALGEKLENDGPEAGEMALRARSAQTYYYGQVAPQNIFNPLAWAEFIKSWKRGDYKKKSSSGSDDNTDNSDK